MRIIYIGAFRFPTYDAAAARVLNIGRALRAAGHEVTYISWGGKYQERSVDGDSDDYYDGFRYFISGELNASGFKKVRRRLSPGVYSLKILKDLLSETDLIIAYNPGYSFNRKLITLCRKHNVKYAADITEWYDNNELKFTDYLPNRLNMTKVNKEFVLNRILISSFLDSYYSTGNNVIVPATCNSTDEKWAVTSSACKCKSPVTLIYAGNPAKKDKLHEVINAVERVEKTNQGRIRLFVLGIDRENYIKRYANLLDNPNISEAVEFKGRVKQDDVPKFYAQAHFMVLLRDDSRKSNAGFPTKFAEAMMSGTAVIANITSDLGLYLNDGVNGFVLPESTSDALFRVLIDILSMDIRDIETMQTEAKKTGLEFFDYRKYIDTLNSFINRLV